MKAISFIAVSILLGACNMSGFKVEIHEPCTYLEKNHPFPPLDPEADKWFKEARRLEKQTGKPRDYKHIAKLYQKAVEKKHWKAMYNLSQLYDVGLGVEKSTEKSMALGNKLIEMDNAYGYVHHGSLYSTGLGVPKDMKKAEQYLYEAAIRGNARIQTYLGDRLIFKHKNRDAEGKHLLECALQQEHWDAADKLSSYYIHRGNDKRKALDYLLLGIKNGNENSIVGLGLFYGGGGLLIKEKHSKTVDCLDALLVEIGADPEKKFPDVETRCGTSYDDLAPNREE